MFKLESRRKRSIIEKRQQQDEKLREISQRKEEDWRYKRELEYLKRRDRQETVERIQKIQEYEREKTLQKIQSDDLRTLQLKMEKSNLLAARREMRSHADKQKEEMMKAFERMQAKGKVDVSYLMTLILLSSRRS
jgi:hypothetical protein